MYSKNDYRYYLENQLMHSDDFLAHYGVKGMKWKQHKKSMYEDQINDPKLSGEARKNAGTVTMNYNRKTGTFKVSAKGNNKKMKGNQKLRKGVSSSGKRHITVYSDEHGVTYTNRRHNSSSKKSKSTNNVAAVSWDSKADQKKKRKIRKTLDTIYRRG